MTADRLRAELTAELAAARRSGEADRRAEAEIALGERHAAADDDRIAAIMTALLRHRDGSTICPSDVARVLDDAWRDRMDEVRAVAARAAAAGRVVVTQGGDTVDVTTARGPVRIGRGRRFDEPPP